MKPSQLHFIAHSLLVTAHKIKTNSRNKKKLALKHLEKVDFVTSFDKIPF